MRTPPAAKLYQVNIYNGAPGDKFQVYHSKTFPNRVSAWGDAVVSMREYVMHNWVIGRTTWKPFGSIIEIDVTTRSVEVINTFDPQTVFHPKERSADV